MTNPVWKEFERQIKKLDEETNRLHRHNIRLHGERNELKKNTDVYLDRIDKLTQENINRDQTIKALRDVVGRQLDAYNRLHHEIEELEKLDWFSCIKRHEDTIRKLMKENELMETSGWFVTIKEHEEMIKKLKVGIEEVTEKYNSLGGSYTDLTKENIDLKKKLKKIQEIL